MGWVRRIASPVVLVSCSTRAATLTVSPINVNSSLLAPPIVPAMTTPVLIPIPMRSSPESFCNPAMNQHRGAHRRISVSREIIRCAEHRQRAVAQELVHMPTGVNHRRHHDLEQRIEPSDDLLGGVRLGERGEVADVDEHHRHLAALTGEHIVTLLQQPGREGGIDIGAERRLKSLPLSQTRLHPVE